jgi:hypothetical protein
MNTYMKKREGAYNSEIKLLGGKLQLSGENFLKEKIII